MVAEKKKKYSIENFLCPRVSKTGLMKCFRYEKTHNKWKRYLHSSVHVTSLPLFMTFQPRSSLSGYHQIHPHHAIAMFVDFWLTYHFYELTLTLFWLVHDSFVCQKADTRLQRARLSWRKQWNKWSEAKTAKQREGKRHREIKRKCVFDLARVKEWLCKYICTLKILSVCLCTCAYLW